MEQSLPHITIDSSKRAQYRLAWQDFVKGWRSFPIWQALALQDIRMRYRRSVLGPLWVTITMAITIASMGLIYADLFHIDMRHYLPYLTAGMICWLFISTLITELSEAFTANEGLIQQIKLPFYLYIHRVAYRNLLVLAHNMVVWLAVIVALHSTVVSYWYFLLFIPSLVIVYINAMTIGLILAMVSARFRDISHMIKIVLQVLFFITPIMWQADRLSPKLQIICLVNPLYAYIELLRAPLLGKVPNGRSYVVILCLSLLGFVFAGFGFSSYRKRIIYWL